jgi:hypothetical protein
VDSQNRATAKALIKQCFKKGAAGKLLNRTIGIVLFSNL